MNQFCVLERYTNILLFFLFICTIYRTLHSTIVLYFNILRCKILRAKVYAQDHTCKMNIYILFVSLVKYYCPNGHTVTFIHTPTSEQGENIVG